MNIILLGKPCIVYYNKDYYRAEIVSCNDDLCTVKCIDYGYTLPDINLNDLYCVPDDEIFYATAIAKKCRLYGLTGSNQENAIEEVIKHIPASEYMSITIENEDENYLYIKLIEENNEILNNMYSSDTALE